MAGPAAELLGAGDDEWFSEALLPGGSAYAGGDGLTKAIALPEGYGIDTGAGWTRTPGGGFYLNTQYGRLDCDSSGQNLTYTLISAPLTPGGRDGDSAQDLLPGISLVDEVGNRAELPLAIRIMDDSPEVSLGAAGSEVFNGKSLEGDWSVIFGADGPSERSALLLEVRAGGGSASPVLLSITPDQALEVRIGGRPPGTLTPHSGPGRCTF